MKKEVKLKDNDYAGSEDCLATPPLSSGFAHATTLEAKESGGLSFLKDVRENGTQKMERMQDFREIRAKHEMWSNAFQSDHESAGVTKPPRKIFQTKMLPKTMPGRPSLADMMEELQQSQIFCKYRNKDTNEDAASVTNNSCLDFSDAKGEINTSGDVLYDPDVTLPDAHIFEEKSGSSEFDSTTKIEENDIIFSFDNIENPSSTKDEADSDKDTLKASANDDTMKYQNVSAMKNSIDPNHKTQKQFTDHQFIPRKEVTPKTDLNVAFPDPHLLEDVLGNEVRRDWTQIKADNEENLNHSNAYFEDSADISSVTQQEYPDATDIKERHQRTPDESPDTHFKKESRGISTDSNPQKDYEAIFYDQVGESMSLEVEELTNSKDLKAAPSSAMIKPPLQGDCNLNRSFTIRVVVEANCSSDSGGSDFMSLDGDEARQVLVSEGTLGMWLGHEEGEEDSFSSQC